MHFLLSIFLYTSSIFCVIHRHSNIDDRVSVSRVFIVGCDDPPPISKKVADYFESHGSIVHIVKTGKLFTSSVLKKHFVTSKITVIAFLAESGTLQKKCPRYKSNPSKKILSDFDIKVYRVGINGLSEFGSESRKNQFKSISTEVLIKLNNINDLFENSEFLKISKDIQNRVGLLPVSNEYYPITFKPAEGLELCTRVIGNQGTVENTVIHLVTYEGMDSYPIYRKIKDSVSDMGIDIDRISFMRKDVEDESATSFTNSELESVERQMKRNFATKRFLFYFVPREASWFIDTTLIYFSRMKNLEMTVISGKESTEEYKWDSSFVHINTKFYGEGDVDEVHHKIMEVIEKHCHTNLLTSRNYGLYHYSNDPSMLRLNAYGHFNFKVFGGNIGIGAQNEVERALNISLLSRPHVNLNCPRPSIHYHVLYNYIFLWLYYPLTDIECLQEYKDLGYNIVIVSTNSAKQEDIRKSVLPIGKDIPFFSFCMDPYKLSMRDRESLFDNFIGNYVLPMISKGKLRLIEKVGRSFKPDLNILCPEPTTPQQSRSYSSFMDIQNSIDVRVVSARGKGRLHRPPTLWWLPTIKSLFGDRFHHN